MRQTAAMGFTYRHSGIAISSAFELPEWQAFEVDDCETCDVQIIDDAGGYQTSPAEDRPDVAGETVHFSVENVASYRVELGRRILVGRAPEAQDAAVRLFTLGSAWGLLGYQRGWAMLHGSAVQSGDGAAFFCGASGHGKSTLAAALAARGHAVLADDLSRVDAGPQAQLHPTATRVKLWQDAVRHLDWQDRPMQRDLMRMDKFHFDIAMKEYAARPEPIIAAYVLEWGDAPAIARLSGGEAVAKFLRATAYRPEFLSDMGALPQQAREVAAIAAGVPIYVLTRPRDLAGLGAVCQMLEEHWQDILKGG